MRFAKEVASRLVEQQEENVVYVFAEWELTTERGEKEANAWGDLKCQGGNFIYFFSSSLSVLEQKKAGKSRARHLRLARRVAIIDDSRTHQAQVEWK